MLWTLLFTVINDASVLALVKYVYGLQDFAHTVTLEDSEKLRGAGIEPSPLLNYARVCIMSHIIFHCVTCTLMSYLTSTVRIVGIAMFYSSKKLKCARIMKVFSLG